MIDFFPRGFGTQCGPSKTVKGRERQVCSGFPDQYSFTGRSGEMERRRLLESLIEGRGGFWCCLTCAFGPQTVQLRNPLPVFFRWKLQTLPETFNTGIGSAMQLEGGMSKVREQADIFIFRL